MRKPGLGAIDYGIYEPQVRQRREAQRKWLESDRSHRPQHPNLRIVRREIHRYLVAAEWIGDEEEILGMVRQENDLLCEVWYHILNKDTNSLHLLFKEFLEEIEAVQCEDLDLYEWPYMSSNEDTGVFWPPMQNSNAD